MTDQRGGAAQMLAQALPSGPSGGRGANARRRGVVRRLTLINDFGLVAHPPQIGGAARSVINWRAVTRSRWIM
jgi:hypothetical protein